MKKAFLILFLSLFCVFAYSQMGITGGLNFSSLRSNGAFDGNTKYKVGFHIGGFYDIYLHNRFYLYSQFIFSYDPTSVTYETESDGKHIKNEFKTNGLYITAPVMLTYKIPVDRSNTIGVDFGVYLSCGLSGNYKTYSNEDGAYNSTSNPLFPDNRERVEAGLIGGVRYEMSSLIFSGHLKYGLSNVDNFEYKPILIMLSVGYKFNK